MTRWAHLLAPGARVLDVACGSGRHLRWLAARGCVPTGIDRDAAALARSAALAETVHADLEAGDWPLPERRFDAVLVTNYLWRPLTPRLAAALAPGGVLLWETFALGQQHLGRPSRPGFLLAPGELLGLCAGLRVLGYEDGLEPADGGRPARCVQRIAAVAAGPGDDARRWALPGCAGAPGAGG